MASSTLDASAKIYAGRVDAIHSETYKVLTGLGRGSEKNNKGTAVLSVYTVHTDLLAEMSCSFVKLIFLVLLAFDFSNFYLAWVP